MSTIREYYTEDALGVRFYDVITSVDPHIKGDIDFYASFLHSPARQVLELGCGTGRVAIALATRGHLVVGVDTSEPMLRRARMKAINVLSGKVTYLNHDMTTLNIRMKFHLIIVPYYTFHHLGSRKLRSRCLAAIVKHLLPGAYAVIHASSPDMFLERRDTRKSIFHATDSPNVRLEVTWSAAEIDGFRQQSCQVIQYELFGENGTRVAVSAERLRLWWFTDKELISCARSVGLEHERTETSFTSERGRSRIFVLRKSGTVDERAG